MITGAHFLLYSADADADRDFLGAHFGFRSVDAGGGWLIFALPPAELAVPGGSRLRPASRRLRPDRRRAVPDVRRRRGRIGLYQPQHPSPLAGS